MEVGRGQRLKHVEDRKKKEPKTGTGPVRPISRDQRQEKNARV